MARLKKSSVDRRGFPKRAAVSAAALAAPVTLPAAQSAGPRPTAPATPTATSAPDTAAPGDVEVLTTDRTGSDFMVDVLKSVGFDYICTNPGSSFRGLHEWVA